MGNTKHVIYLYMKYSFCVSTTSKAKMNRQFCEISVLANSIARKQQYISYKLVFLAFRIWWRLLFTSYSCIICKRPTRKKRGEMHLTFFRGKKLCFCPVEFASDFFFSKTKQNKNKMHLYSLFNKTDRFTITFERQLYLENILKLNYTKSIM